MSVAFRRESDEEHLEPRFELPLPPGPNPVTANGLAEIEARVAELEQRVREPLDADALKDQQRQLRYWRTRLASAEVTAAAVGDEAGFGSRVRFRLNGREQLVTIVGHDEADGRSALVGVGAPLARALLGAAAGDLLSFSGKADALEVLEVGSGV